VEVGQGRRLTVREQGGARHLMGQEVRLELSPEFCHLFRPSGEALPLRHGTASPAPSSPDLTSSAA
jgi:multiple sugar transport system ATP-binding protein